MYSMLGKSNPVGQVVRGVFVGVCPRISIKNDVPISGGNWDWEIHDSRPPAGEDQS